MSDDHPHCVDAFGDKVYVQHIGPKSGVEGLAAPS